MKKNLVRALVCLVLAPALLYGGIEATNTQKMLEYRQELILV